MRKIIKWTPRNLPNQNVNLFPNLEKSCDLNGRHLTVVANDGDQFVHLVEQPDGSLKVNGGLDVEICNIFARKFNFSWVLICVFT